MSGRIPQSFIDDLLARVDIVEVIDSRVPLKKAGRDYTACCPFHSEKTPSFSVSQTKQFYHCFGCGAHGSAIGFLMEYEHLEFVEAIEELARGLAWRCRARRRRGARRRTTAGALLPCWNRPTAISAASCASIPRPTRPSPT
jgi:DNA primase catalytic core